MRVLFQIGRSKSRKRTQSIEAYINDLKMEWGDDSGKFLTSHKDRVVRNTIWYLYETELESGDTLTLDVKTFIAGAGVDEELTFKALYCADESRNVNEVNIHKVGMPNYPVVKGRVSEIATVTEDAKRKQEIDDFLNEGF